MSRFVALSLAGGAACLFTLAGIYTVSRYGEKVRDWSAYFIGFAAGMIIAVSFLHLVPKAFSQYDGAGAFFLAGFVGLFLLEQLLDHHEPGDAAPADHHIIGLLALVGVGFHSLVDGGIYAITFTIDMLTGVLSSVGMVLHEFPEGIIVYTLLREGGYDRKPAWILSFAAAGLTTPAGALLAYPFMSALSSATLGRLLGLSGGFLIYLGAVHLLPRVLEKKDGRTVWPFFGGILLAIVIRLVG